MLDARRGRSALVAVGDAGWVDVLATSVVDADGFSRACWAGSKGIAPGGRLGNAFSRSCGLLADCCACDDCTGEPGCVAWYVFGLWGACCSGWRLDIVRDKASEVANHIGEFWRTLSFS